MDVHALLHRFNGLPPAQVAARVNEQLPLVVSLMAVVLIGSSLGQVFWLVYPTDPRPPWQAPQRSAGGAEQARGQTDFSTIAAAHLFGTVSLEPPLLTEDAALNAPDTSLSLQLRGAIAAEDPRFAHAIIGDGNGNEQVYFVNDTVPGGATVQQILIDRVILARGGQLEVLRLPRDGVANLAPQGIVSGTAKNGAAANVQQLVAENAAGFLEIVRPQPFMPNGQLKGYRIYPGPNRQQFASLGLRAGDLVTEINGIPMNNPAQGMEVFRSLGNTSSVTLTVERDGQPQQLSLNMNQMNLSGATQ